MSVVFLWRLSARYGKERGGGEASKGRIGSGPEWERGGKAACGRGD